MKTEFKNDRYWLWMDVKNNYINEFNSVITMIDTGFSEHVALVPEVVDALGLQYSHKRVNETAGGQVEYKIYKALIKIDDKVVETEIETTDGLKINLIGIKELKNLFKRVHIDLENNTISVESV
jgi:clan AA aspartic protease